VGSWQLSKQNKVDWNAGGQSRQLVIEGSAIKDALKEAKHGNTLPLFMLATSFCSLSDGERNDVQHGLLEYHHPDMVRRVEKILIAYRRGSWVAGGWPKDAATKQVMEEFGRSRGLVHTAIADNKKRGGVFSL
jgi:hypothetical protein